MAHPEIEEWLNTSNGVAMNPDGHYGLQCVDLADQFAQDLSGAAWPKSMGGVQGAKQLLDAAPDEYWIRVDNDMNNPDLLPPRGALLIYGGRAGVNQWGHVAACLASDVNGCRVRQQDGFAAPLIYVDGGWYSNKPAHEAYLPHDGYGTGPLIGWLIFKEEKLANYVPPAASAPAVLVSQRVTGPLGVNGRSAAVRGDNVVQPFAGDLILTFKGFVHGENIDGNDIWFVGQSSGNYFHSSAFTDQSTSGLPDLTPAPAPAPATQPVLGYQRVTGANGVILRTAAHSTADVVKTFDPDLILDFKGYVHGEDPYGGNDIWFVGKYSDTYVWSGNFTDSGTHDLPNLTPAEAPPVVDKYDFDLDFTELTREDGVVIKVEKMPAAIGNFQKGNPTAKHENAVIHQFGTPGVDTIGSTGNQFAKPGTQVSAYWSVSGRTVRQHVALRDRAYHASTVGNDYIGIETDPNQDPETIATVRALLIALNKREGTKVLWLHKDVPGNKTACGSLIDLKKYITAVKPIEIPIEVVTPPSPPVVTPPASETPGPDHSAEVVSLLQKILAILTRIFGGGSK